MTRTSLSARLNARKFEAQEKRVLSAEQLPKRRLKWTTALVTVAVLFVSGCNLQIKVELDIEEDGSGTVTAGVGLDPDAQVRFPNINELLVASDLLASGWTVIPPQVLSDGQQWVQVTKGFVNPTDLQAVLDELFGSGNGVFRDFQINRQSSDTEKTFELRGTVDLSAGIELFSDQALQDILDVPPIGFDLDEIESNLGGTPVEQVVQTRLVVRLPGGGDEQTFDIALGDIETIEANAGSENRLAQLLSWVRLALLILLGVAVALVVFSYVIDRRSAKSPFVTKPKSVRDRVPRPRGTDDSVSSQISGRQTLMQLVVLDAYGVLFREPTDSQERLIKFIRQRASDATDVDILEYHRQATLGRMRAAAFWQSVQIQGNPEELEAHLLAEVGIQQGAREFLREMHRRGIPVAVITNDLAEWSYRLRDLHGMSGVAPWIVSSEIGVRKPDPAAFEALRRVTGVPYHSMLIVDSEIPSLDVARSLGMSTAWFNPESSVEASESEHPMIAKFGDFFRRRRPQVDVGGRRRWGSS